MKQKLFRLRSKLVFLVFFVTAMTLPLQKTFAHEPEEPPSYIGRLVFQLTKVWRSSDRFIDHETVRKQIIGDGTENRSGLIKSFSRIALQGLSEELVELSKKNGNSLKINREVAVNILKSKIEMDALAKCSSAIPCKPEHVIKGYSEEDLEKMVAGISRATSETKLPTDFDYVEHQYRNLLSTSNNIFSNDLYVFKIAYAFWKMGLVSDVELTSDVMVRGNKEIGVFAAAGQDDVLRLLREARFTPKDIETLKSKGGLENADPKFFDALLRWRFKGTVRMRKPGTLMAPGTPYMSITGSIFDLLFAEAPALAQVSLAVGSATIAHRISMAAGNTPMVEGGTRRAFMGLLRAKYAYIYGFVGTSNLQASQLFDIPAMGSGGNHAAINIGDAVWGDESDFHLAMMGVFDWRPLRFLIDAFDILEGTRKVIRATRGQLGGIRVDSEIEGKNVVETLQAVENLLVDSGFLKGTRPQISYTNDMNANSIAGLKAAGAAFDSGLVGGAIATPPNFGIVMKAVQIKYKGKLYPLTKTANPEKSHYPNQKNVVRVMGPDGKIAKEHVLDISEELPEGSQNVLYEAMKAGEFTQTLPTIQEQRANWLKDVALFQPKALVNANYGSVPVTFSKLLVDERAAYIKAHSPKSHYRVGLFFGSFDGVHPGHLGVMARAHVMYGLDKVIIGPTGAKSIQTATYNQKTYRLSPEARVQMIRRKTAHLPWVEVYTGEAYSPRALTTFENIKAIEQTLPEGSEIFVFMGQDLMEPFADFSHAKEMLEKYHWIFAEREGSAPKVIKTPADLARALGTKHEIRDRGLKESGFLLRMPRPEDGSLAKVVELQPMRTGDSSSSNLRKFYDGLKVSFRLIVGEEEIDPKNDPFKITPYFFLSGFQGWIEKAEKLALEGYNVYAVVDANTLRGISPENAQRLLNSGTKFLSIDEYTKVLPELQKLDWAGVLNKLAELETKSQQLATKELKLRADSVRSHLEGCVSELKNSEETR